ncbi:hypothetical protein [Novosphingobium sp. SG707]|uniref:hypothetical protein n=1 Tax=Novosphingobium sp. SG707 TaxID=2586996 RepID=UPI001445B788|nr:hypothetical protein [Novosphingobium sp. SG707]NKI99122.1 GTPase SAR1 family protein [Novosphingobium sp. SG707]
MKFILVFGPTNSGKSTAITHFCDEKVSNVRKRVQKYNDETVDDFRATGTILKNGQLRDIAIASAGDVRAIIEQNFSFFKTLNPVSEIILISAKQTGQGIPYQVTIEQIENYLSHINQQVDEIDKIITIIQTNKLAKNANDLELEAERDRVVQAIYDAI